MTRDDTRRILIAGAGIGGLATAIALKQKGFEAEIFERRENILAERGTALNIWSNAITALNRLGLGDAVVATGARIRRQTIYSYKGDLLMDTPVEQISRVPSVNLRRSDLMRILRAGAEDVPIRFGVAVTGYRQDADGVTLLMENGEEVRGAALIGADGIRSAIRKQMTGCGEPEYLGYTIWRGISSGPVGIEPGNLAMFWGTNGLNGGCWAVDDTRFSWTIGLNTEPGGKDEPGTVKRKLLTLLEKFPEPMKKAVELTPEEDIFRIDGHAWTEAETWIDGRVVLLGDAAHAMPTVYGQGACQALEDAVVLAESLAGATDVREGLRRYVDRRKPRMDWIRGKVFFGAKMQKMGNPLFVQLKNMYLKHFFPQKANLATWQRLLAFDDEGVEVERNEQAGVGR
ncbi:FAD-dependent monooxygenase [Staphylospora marina]|uniref:FAD-dependent monooxygenase n=1 Tax=Staphylospora marina TaxID=2490858 RepID=UPI000F5BF542|nr:FAD-dependent monooxygenase [Staphylospora marina]